MALIAKLESQISQCETDAKDIKCLMEQDGISDSVKERLSKVVD